SRTSTSARSWASGCSWWPWPSGAAPWAPWNGPGSASRRGSGGSAAAGGRPASPSTSPPGGSAGRCGCRWPTAYGCASRPTARPRTVPRPTVRGRRPAVPSTADLRAVDVTVNFGRVQALDGVSVEFRPGSLLGVMGPNGAGKTTLLNALTGALRINGGEVWLGERRIDRLTPWKRRAAGIARTFQRCELVPELSVEENVLIGAHPRLRLFDELLARVRSADVRAAMDHWLDRFAIGRQLRAAPVATLPYGW